MALTKKDLIEFLKDYEDDYQIQIDDSEWGAIPIKSISDDGEVIILSPDEGYKNY